MLGTMRWQFLLEKSSDFFRMDNKIENEGLA
jgi:hypothetical protein